MARVNKGYNWRWELKRQLQLLSIVIALFSACEAFSQSNEAALTGTVQDTTGAKVVGAMVRAVHADTNATRTTETTGTGTYYLGNLPVGVYVLSVSAKGFNTRQLLDIELVVGQVRTEDVRLDIGKVAEEVRVEDTAPALSKSSAEISGVIENQQIQDLPLNGRNIAGLLALVPGAIDSGGASISSIRFAGRGNDDSNFRMDGVDNTGIRAQNLNASLLLQIPLEAVSEFKVATLLYGADTGGTAGGQVELASQTGTNRFHGAVYDFLRNNYFDSEGPFDKTTPNLKFNNFGASLGGPVLKDRTFFFVTYGGFRQLVAQNLKATVPSDAFRATVLATSPALAPFLNAYPEGNGAANGADGTFYTSSTSTTNVENSYFFRVSHVFSSKDNVFVRYNIDVADITAPSGSLRDVKLTNTSPMNATIQYTHVFTPTLLNESRVGFNRAWSVGSTTGYLTTSQNINWSLALGFNSIASLSNSTASVSAPSSYSYLDDLTKIVGNHTFKAGVEIKDVQFNYGQVGVNQLQYNSAAAFVNNALDFVNDVAQVPVHGLHKVETFAYAQDQFKMSPRLTLTYGLRYEFFNVLHEVHGLSRAFDPATCPAGNCPQGGQFTFPVTTNFEPRVSFAWEPKRLNEKMVVRGGAGVYHGEAQLGDLNAPSDNFTTLFTLAPADFPGLSWPVAPFIQEAQTNAQAVTPRGLQRKRLDPRVTQYGLQVQTALPFRFILDTGYMGSWGDHQFYRTYVNNYNYDTLIRPLPGFAQVDYKEAEGTTNFDAWQSSLQRQFHQGLGIQVNYLWSHSLNDGSTGGGEGDYPNNVNCMGCEYANSDQDVRHSLSVNAIYDLPFGQGHSLFNHGIAKELLGGITANSIISARSGLPINVVLNRQANYIDPKTGQIVYVVPDGNNTDHSAGVSNLRPDRVPGVSLTPPGSRSSLPGRQWINPAAFATPANNTWGNAPRNPVDGPNLWQADLGTGKKFQMGERVSAEFRGEIFNILNRSQYANPTSDFTGIATATTPAALQAAQASFANTTSTINTSATGSGTPRRIQFALRITY
jgi:hypothetical protein